VTQLKEATLGVEKTIDARCKKKALKVLKLIRETIHQNTALRNVSSASDSTPFRVLIATMLSARTRDPVTELVSAKLFRIYPDAKSLSRAKVSRVEKIIRPVNFYHTKALRLVQVSRIISKCYNGETPVKMEQLLELPGVGRKTANCVLVYAYKTPAIPVDVHVHRISNRIGLVDTRSPELTETELSRIYDQKYWLSVNELFVAFGQTVCKPIVPRCGICNVRPLCDYYRNLVKTTKRPASA
jgi:endonuclease III